MDIQEWINSEPRAHQKMDLANSVKFITSINNTLLSPSLMVYLSSVGGVP